MNLQLQASAEQSAVVFEIMKRFRAAEIIHQLLRLLPDKFVEAFVRFVFFDEVCGFSTDSADANEFQMQRDATLDAIAQQLDKSLIVALLYTFEGLIIEHSKVYIYFAVITNALLLFLFYEQKYIESWLVIVYLPTPK